MNKQISFNLLKPKLKIDLSPFPHALSGCVKKLVRNHWNSRKVILMIFLTMCIS